MATWLVFRALRRWAAPATNTSARRVDSRSTGVDIGVAAIDKVVGEYAPVRYLRAAGRFSQHSSTAPLRYTSNSSNSDIATYS